ncbi:hypothetical protein, partial [Streptomyces ardesiacus]
MIGDESSLVTAADRTREPFLALPRRGSSGSSAFPGAPDLVRAVCDAVDALVASCWAVPEPDHRRTRPARAGPRPPALTTPST